LPSPSAWKNSVKNEKQARCMREQGRKGKKITCLSLLDRKRGRTHERERGTRRRRAERKKTVQGIGKERRLDEGRKRDLNYKRLPGRGEISEN